MKTNYVKGELPEEFMDVLKIMDPPKYTAGSWLDRENPSLQPTANLMSMCRHLYKIADEDYIDDESMEYHHLHLAARALMEYTRIKRGIGCEATQDRKYNRSGD